MEIIYAIIHNNVIVNTIIADPVWILNNYADNAIRIDHMDPRPGVGWTAQDTAWIPPVYDNHLKPPSITPAVVPANTTLTLAQFRARFTLAEMVAIDNFAVNDSLSTEQKATLNTITKNFDTAGSIDLSADMTQQSLDYIVACGLLELARATEILTP